MAKTELWISINCTYSPFPYKKSIFSTLSITHLVAAQVKILGLSSTPPFPSSPTLNPWATWIVDRTSKYI